jgi:hypothetical protein
VPDVDINLNLRGADEVSRGLRGNADAAEETRRRVDGLQSSLTRLQTVAPTLPLSQADAAQRLGRSLSGQLERAKAQELGSRTGVLAADPSAELRSSAEAQRNRVRLAEQLRAEEERSRQAEARQSQDAQRNRVRLAEQLRIDQERFEDRRRREESRLARPGPAARGAAADEAEGFRYQNPLAGTGFARLAQPLFIAHAVAQTFEGLAKGVEELAKREHTAGEAVGILTKNLAEGIPIIGGFVRGVESLVDVFSGAASLRARAGSQAADVTAAGAARFAASLTPDRLAEFGPARLAGGEQSPFGPLRFAAAQAESEVAAARELVALRARQTREAGAAQQRAASPGRLALSALSAVGPAGSELVVPMVMIGAAKARAEAEERASQAVLGLAQKEFEAKQRLLDLDKARIGVLEKLADTTRQGFLQAGVAAPGQSQDLLMVMDRLRTGRVGDVLPELRQQAMANPFTRAETTDILTKFGEQDPAARELSRRATEYQRQRLGAVGEGGLIPPGAHLPGDLDAEIARRSAGVMRGGAEARAELAGAEADAARAMFERAKAVVRAEVAAAVREGLDQWRAEADGRQQRGRRRE